MFKVLQDKITALDAEREALRSEAQTIADTAEGETRSLTDDETARMAAIAARGPELLKERDEAERQLKGLESLAEERSAQFSAPTFIRKPEPAKTQDVRGMDFKALDDMFARNAEEAGIGADHARSILKRHRNEIEWVRNIAARSTEAYVTGFAKAITGREMFLTAEERAAIAVGTNTQGGLLVPTHLDPTLILTNDGTQNAVRQMARVVTLGMENTWHGATTTGSTFSWDAELAEVSDDSPTFVAPSIPVYTGAGFIQASFAAFDDIANLASDVLMLFADGRDRLEAAAHCTGTGSGQPTGIFTALDANTNVEITSTTAATIGLVDLEGMKRGVGPRWRGRGSWLMNPVWADAIRNLGTALSASYSVDITQSNTDLLLGRPVVESDDAPSTATTTALDNEIVFGDFSNYVIVDKPGSTSIDFIPVLFNTATNLPDGRRGWYMRFRSGADSVNDLAFTILQDKTSA